MCANLVRLCWTRAVLGQGQGCAGPHPKVAAGCWGDESGGLGLRAEWLCLDVAPKLRFEAGWLGCAGVLEDWAMSYELSLPTM